MASTDKKYNCYNCGDNFFTGEACSECCGEKLTATEARGQIIRLAPNNLTAIELIENYGLNK